MPLRCRLYPGRRRARSTHVSASAVRAEWHAAADHLGERGEVGLHAEARLRAAVGEPEAGHHFVEHQQRTVLRGERAEPLEEALGGWDAAHVAGHRLDDQRCDLRAVLFEQLLGGREIVVRQGQRGLGDVGGDAALSGSPMVARPLPALTSRYAAPP